MSVFGTLNRADNNNKGAIPNDHGTGLFPLGKYTLTRYGMVARIEHAIKYRIQYSGGRLIVISLEDHPYPPGDPTQSTDSRRQNPVGLRDGKSETGLYDYVAVTGTNNFDGEHRILSLGGGPGSLSDRTLIAVDLVNPPNQSEDYEIIESDAGSAYIADTSRERNKLMDPQRVMSHPAFPQREGEGIYTYPYPPDITRNFIYHPAVKVDGVVQKTVGSNILIAQPQLEEDVIISEMWLGGDRQLSTLTEMFRLFFMYWTTSPGIGEVLGWEPRDRTGDRFGIQLVRVQLGGLDYEYNEVREYVDRNKDSFLDRQLTVQFKLARRSKPPRPSISMEGR